ncbi:MAG: type VI secretion system contractile sheath large subunit [Immundisolibacterales bacterium]|nr:type VI secretion system contractile sheath large subunit [Immundisolibacterales bacterium]
MSASAQQQPATQPAPEGGVLERILTEGRLAREEHQVAGARTMLQGFVAEALHDGVRVDAGAKRAIAERIAALDRLIAEQVNEVLHHPRLQKLEATWRSLDKLVAENDLSSSMRVRVLNCHRAEIERDLARAPAFDQSRLFKSVYESEYGTLGGTPYSFLVGDFEIGRSPKDIDFARQVAGVAAMAHAPLYASASPDLLDLDGFGELDRPIDLAAIFDASEMAAWRSLRDHPDSRYLVLTAPRVLVRAPWGPDSVEEMHFVEEVEGPDASRYLWGSAAWRVADVTMKSFGRYGWPCAIRGTEGGGRVENLPLHVFPSLSGARITQCPTEINITDRREKELSDQGIIALCHAKHTDYAVFFSGSTVHRPKKYVEDDATANARLSASLPYVLACARFAHYLMAIKRDRIGAFSSRVEDEQMLNTWISQYVTADDSASHGAKARYPLREARVTVEDVAGKPGVRRAVAHLRPHYQLEGLSASLRLVAELPAQA